MSHMSSVVDGALGGVREWLGEQVRERVVGPNAEVGLVPSYGFGGHNSCIAVTRWAE